MFKSENNERGTCALWWCCESCETPTWPVRRIAGMPTERAWAAVEKGIAVLTGCSESQETDTHQFQCPLCGYGCDIDEKLQAEGWWDL